MKTAIIRDKKGEIVEIIEMIQEGDIDEYIAYDEEELEGDPYE